VRFVRRLAQQFALRFALLGELRLNYYVGMPHAIWGESPHACVVLRRGMLASDAEPRDFARA
jgi:hypothetical protein